MIRIGILMAMCMAIMGCASYKWQGPDGQSFTAKSFLQKRQLSKAQLTPGTYIEGYRAQGEAESIAPLIAGIVDLATGMAVLRTPPAPLPAQIIVVTQIVERVVEPEPAAVDPAPDPDEPAGPPVGDGVWNSKPHTIDLPDSDWAVKYEVRGLVKNPGRADDGKWEHIFSDLRGQGFERMMLMNMGDDRPKPRPSLRAYTETAAGKKEINRSLPDGGLASINWTRKGGNIAVTINGDDWFDITIDGTPEYLIVGGGSYHNRHFSGQWRGLELTPSA